MSAWQQHRRPRSSHTRVFSSSVGPLDYIPRYKAYLTRITHSAGGRSARRGSGMSGVQHAVTGTTLSFVLEDEMQTVRENLGSSGRTGRTLVKDGPLRVTLVGLGAG